MFRTSAVASIFLLGVCLLSLELRASCGKVFFRIDKKSLRQDMRGDFFVHIIPYMLRGLAGSSTALRQNSRGVWRLSTRSMPPRVAQQTHKFVQNYEPMDAMFLRELFFANYFKTIGARNQQKYIKGTLRAMLESTQYKSWSSFIKTMSLVKAKSVRTYRSPEGFVPAMSIIETLDTEFGDPDADILETEVAIQRQDSADYDFYAYDELGRMRTFSDFPSGSRGVPHVCINCHYDPKQATVNLNIRR